MRPLLHALIKTKNVQRYQPLGKLLFGLNLHTSWNFGKTRFAVKLGWPLLLYSVTKVKQQESDINFRMKRVSFVWIRVC